MPGAAVLGPATVDAPVAIDPTILTPTVRGRAVILADLGEIHATVERASLIGASRLAASLIGSAVVSDPALVESLEDHREGSVLGGGRITCRREPTSVMQS